MLSKCGHGHLHIWTRKKNFARVPKAALTSNHQTVSYVFVASQLTLLSPSVTLVSPVSIISRVFLVRDAPKYQSCIVQKGGGWGRRVTMNSC